MTGQSPMTDAISAGTGRLRRRVAELEADLDDCAARLADSYEELSLVYQINGGLNVNRRPADFFRQVCLDAIGVLGARGMGVALPPGDATLYGPLALPPAVLARLGGQLLNAFAPGEDCAPRPILVNRTAGDPAFDWCSARIPRLLATPMRRGDALLGVAFALDKLGDGDAGDFVSQDAKLLAGLAHEAAVYLENSALYEESRGLTMGLVHSLVSAVDAKDPYTCGHSARVASLARALAAEVGLPDAGAERVYLAGLLHDVGKIGVADTVLQKAGKLTAEEFEEMKRHPTVGARILGDVRQLRDILPGVLHHHERYDGRGYPHGLAGEGIPLMGRLLCLADSFDAMTSTRTYRHAMPLASALVEIRRCAGAQFDPALAEAFVGLGANRLAALVRPPLAASQSDEFATPLSLRSRKRQDVRPAQPDAA